MNEATRNAMVGVLVLVALSLMGLLIVWFGESPLDFRQSYQVKIVFDRAAGLTPEAGVFLKGQRIGQVEEVGFVNPQQADQGILVVVRVEDAYNIPRYASAAIEPPPPLGGKASVNIVLSESEAQRLAATDPLARSPLSRDGKATLVGTVTPSLMDLAPTIATEISSAAGEISKLAQRFDSVGAHLEKLTMPMLLSEVDKPPTSDDPSIEAKLANLSTVIQRLDITLKHVNAIVGKPENQRSIEESLGNFREASQNIREASAKATSVMDKIDALRANLDQGITDARTQVNSVGGKAVSALSQMEQALNELKKAAQDLSQGEGTAGLLLRDRRLYESLVATSDRLQGLVASTDALIQEWKKNGVNIAVFGP